MNPMSPRRGQVGRADLLQLLAQQVADASSMDAPSSHTTGLVAPLQLLQPLPPLPQAQAAGFVFCPVDVPVPEPAQATRTSEAVYTMPAQEPALWASTPQQPLRAPLLGIVSVQVLDTPEASARPQLPPLRAQDFLPTGPAVPFQPLLPHAKLARRLRTLAQPKESRRIDLAQAVQQAARARWPQSWPREHRPYAPQHVLVLVDRSLHLRPYWDDQDQWLQHLGRWIGLRNITTLTVQGDPWQATACWSQGQAQPAPATLYAPPANTLVLLMSDLAVLKGATNHGWAQEGAAAATPLALAAQDHARASWQRAHSLLQSRGAQVVAWLLASHPGMPTALADLLTLLACARRIEPALVRAMRCLVPQLANQPGLEAQLWACHHLFDVGYEVCVWRSKQVGYWRQQFEKLDAALQQAALETMLQVHAACGRVIVMQELLAWACHVKQATASPYEQKVIEAQQWMQRLTSVSGDVAQSNPGLIAFAQQTHAFQQGDSELLRRYHDAFGPLWALACVGAQQQAQSLPDPGALPVERLGQWFSPTQVADASVPLLLQQQGAQLVLQPGLTAAPASPMGMALDSALLTVQLGGQPARQYASTEGGLVLAESVPQQSLHLYTGTLALKVGPIRSPFLQAEHGRDQYGLYAKIAPVFAGEVVLICMRYIEPGQFLMGSPEDEDHRDDIEGPQHLVTITQGFWLAETACTQQLWQAVMGENPSHFTVENKGGPQHPVESVSWDDSQQFLARLQGVLREQALFSQGFEFCLPVEAEWEYACRAGSSSAYHFGDVIHTDLVNYNGKRYWNDEKSEGVCRESTFPVAALLRNDWGLCQMHGNVWEWCADRMREYQAMAVVDPGVGDELERPTDTGAEVGRSDLVVRGGSWSGSAQRARSACRGRFTQDGRDGFLGLRFACRSRSQANQAWPGPA